MLVHTSGRKSDHEADRLTIEKAVRALTEKDSVDFDVLVKDVYETAEKLYPEVDPEYITSYVVANASRVSLVVLNSERDRKAAGDNASEPTSPFTVIIGGNIVSRGVTFPNLLAMFFTRNVQSKLQQDTYIQRARMFGARGAYLEHFELTIPMDLYADWHRCFVFHRLALATVKSKLGAPVWISDNRIAVASSASIDKATVALDKGEMSFGIFDYKPELNRLILKDQTSLKTLTELRAQIGNDALPSFLIDYIKDVAVDGSGAIAIHTSSSIEGYGETADHTKISRDKGFMGKSQLELKKFPDAVHHIKILFNGSGRAKVFYKYRGSLQFIQNLGSRN